MFIPGYVKTARTTCREVLCQLRRHDCYKMKRHFDVGLQSYAGSTILPKDMSTASVSGLQARRQFIQHRAARPWSSSARIPRHLPAQCYQ